MCQLAIGMSSVQVLCQVFNQIVFVVVVCLFSDIKLYVLFIYFGY